MTAKEAIQRIRNHNEIHSAKEPYFAVHITEALNMAVEALEKQIPKKVISEKRSRAKCPTCKRIVEDYKEVNGGRSTILCVPDICPFCGQALDV